MLDTLQVARSLTDAGLPADQADAITDAVRAAAADYATRADLDGLRSDVRADLAALEARLTWRFAGAMLAQTAAILAAVIGAAFTIIRVLA